MQDENNAIVNQGRLYYIEPNDFASYYNLKNEKINSNELSWEPEDLAMSVDLQVIIPRREDKGQKNYLMELKNATIQDKSGSALSRFVSYMGGVPLNQKDDSKSYLTDNYTNISFQEIKDGKVIDSESLGINSIDINFDAHFFPLVTMNFTDTRGSSLFMPSEYEFFKAQEGKTPDENASSFFKALFHFPYPRFLLSVKGFYGNKVTFQLAVSDFKSSFQSESGNYSVTIKFIGYVYGLYTDLPLNLVMASPYYNDTYWTEQQNNGVFTYVTKDGKSGGKILTYPQFIEKVEGKDFSGEVFANADVALDYVAKKNKIKILYDIIKLHENFSVVKIGDENLNRVCNGTSCSFRWAVTKVGDNDKNGLVYKFIMPDELSKSYYQKIREYLSSFHEPEDIALLNNNVYYNNLYTNLSSLTTNVPELIIKDEEMKYLQQFQVVSGYELSKYLSVDSSTGIITKNDGLRNAVQTDEVFLKDFCSSDGVFINGHALPKPNNADTGLVVNFGEYVTFLTNEINSLKNEIEGEQKELAESLDVVFENIIGFTPTVENFYRMLFAHMDCFMDFYNDKILKKIEESTNIGERSIQWLGMGDEMKFLDIPKSMKGGMDNTKVNVFPFPGYFVEKDDTNSKRIVAEYPGVSQAQRFREIREVWGVDKIISGVKLLTEKMEEAASGGNKSNEGGDTAISILSVLYGGKNPWESFNWDDEANADGKFYKFLYFYICQIIAEKAIGINVDKNGEIDDAYLDRQVDAIMNSGLEFPNDVVKKISSYHVTTAEDFLSKLYNDKISFLNPYGQYKLYTFNIFNENVLRYAKQSDSGRQVIKVSVNLDNIVLNPDSEIFNVPVNSFYDPSTGDIEKRKKYVFLSKTVFYNDEGQVINRYYTDFNIIGNNGEYLSLPSNESISYDTLKKLHTKLCEFGNATEYLNVGINLGGIACTAFLRDNFSFYELRDKTKQYIIDINKNCRGCWQEKFGSQLGDQILSFVQMNEHDEKTKLMDFYNLNNKNGKILFVGNKLRECKTSPSTSVDANSYYDEYPVVNIFSGIKELYHYKDKVKDPGEINEFYKPLIKQNRCYVSDDILPNGITITKEELQHYTFATYFLAILSGYNSLSNIILKIRYYFIRGINNNNIFKPSFTPFRKVDILYLGGLLYFTKYKLSIWNKNGEKIVSDLLKTSYVGHKGEDGEIGHGLLYTDHESYIKDSQKLYDVDYFFNEYGDLTELGQDLVNRFELWCTYELFGSSGMYDKLAGLGDESEYVDVSGFYSKKEIPIFTATVQAYKEGSECSKWLTDLYYAYDFIYSVKFSQETRKQDKIEINLSEGNDVKNFMKKLYQKLNEKQINAELQSRDLDKIQKEYNETLDHKRGVYYLLKNLYDKWLCSYSPLDFKLDSPEVTLQKRKARFSKIDGNTSNIANTSEYNNFIYVDQYFNDISALYKMDVDKICEVLKQVKTGKENMDVYSFMAYMAEKNKLLLLALPVYNNMYNAKSILSVFKPNTLYDSHTYDDYNGIGTTYVLMHTNEVSYHPGEYEGNDFTRDYIDIANVTGNTGADDIKYFTMPSTEKQENSSALNYNVSAFAVTYGKQNQMYFKKVDVNMDNPKVTDESIKNLLILSEAGTQGDTNQPVTIGQNFYSIYANRSYTCTVEMLGCANIMPLMYFQLNNIPMFRGLYMIINVRHNIKAGDMTTIFTGVRVSRYSLPDISNVLINSSIFNKLEQSEAWKNENGGNRNACDDLRDGIKDTQDKNDMIAAFKKALDNDTTHLYDNYFTESDFPNLAFAKLKRLVHSNPSLWLTDYINGENVEAKFPVNNDLSTHINKLKILPGLAKDLDSIYNDIKQKSIDTGIDYDKCFITSMYRPDNDGSSHYAGLAIDIGNGGKNPYLKNLKCEGLEITNDTSLAYRTWEHPVVQIFMKHGWGWGIYRTERDYMHFSYNIWNNGTSDGGIIKRIGH